MLLQVVLQGIDQEQRDRWVVPLIPARGLVAELVDQILEFTFSSELVRNRLARQDLRAFALLLLVSLHALVDVASPAEFHIAFEQDDVHETLDRADVPDSLGKVPGARLGDRVVESKDEIGSPLAIGLNYADLAYEFLMSKTSSD